MTWKEYYDRYDGWQESSQYSRLASITDFGPETSPAEDIVDCVQFVNEKTAQSILHRAISAGVLFSGAQIEELLNVGIFEDAKDVRLLLRANTGDFTADNLVEILCCVSDPTEVENLISELSSKPIHFQPKDAISLYEEMSDETIANKMLLSVDTRFSEEDINELCDWGADEAVIKKLCRQSGIPYADPDAEDEYEPQEDIPPTGKKCGMFGTLVGILGSGGSLDETPKVKKHSGRCDGDCAHCPPHYGYRY